MIEYISVLVVDTELTNKSSNAFVDAAWIWGLAWNILDTPLSYLGGYSLLEILIFFVIGSATIGFIYNMTDKKSGQGLTPPTGAEITEGDLIHDRDWTSYAEPEKEMPLFYEASGETMREYASQRSIEGIAEDWNYGSGMVRLSTKNVDETTGEGD